MGSKLDIEMDITLDIMPENSIVFSNESLTHDIIIVIGFCKRHYRN
jgi:hypothetical protein